MLSLRTVEGSLFRSAMMENATKATNHPTPAYSSYARRQGISYLRISTAGLSGVRRVKVVEIEPGNKLGGQHQTDFLFATEIARHCS